MKSKLSKKMVMDTSIPDQVSEIKGSDQLNLRIASILLFGLVVIHEKKSQYIFGIVTPLLLITADVNDILIYVKKSTQIKDGKKKKSKGDVTRPVAGQQFNDVPLDLADVLQSTDLPSQSFLDMLPSAQRSSRSTPRSLSRVSAIENVRYSPFGHQMSFNPLGTPQMNPMGEEMDELFAINGIEMLDVDGIMNDMPPLNLELDPIDFEEQLPIIEGNIEEQGLQEEEHPLLERRKRKKDGKTEIISLDHELLKYWIANPNKIVHTPQLKVPRLSADDQLLSTGSWPYSLMPMFEGIMKQTVQEFRIDGHLQTIDPTQDLFEEPELMRANSVSRTPIAHNLITPQRSSRTISSHQTIQSGFSDNLLEYDDLSIDYNSNMMNDLPEMDLELPLMDDVLNSSTGNDLYQKFVDSIPMGEVVEFDRIIRNSNKKAVAKTFADMLILASQSLVNVAQDVPYGSIVLNIL
ncbi:hypothetical protein GEMRC1_005363 [Eukaryota sp. GEM-RC1]